MTGIPETLHAIADVFIKLGVSNFILLVVAGLVVWSVVKGRVAGASTKDALAEAVTPVTCMWSETDRKELAETVERLERIERDIAILKDRRG